MEVEHNLAKGLDLEIWSVELASNELVFHLIMKRIGACLHHRENDDGASCYDLGYTYRYHLKLQGIRVKTEVVR